SAAVLALWARTVFSPEDLAGVLAGTSIAFDMSVFELFVTLAWGGKVILAANALELPRLPAAGEVTLVNTVPSAMAELVRLRALPASVRTVNLGGEPLQRSLVQAVYGAGPVSRVLNLYGPSEDTTYSTWELAARGETGEPTLGRPLSGTRTVVLGRFGELMPVGVPGELFLGGAGLARGYLGRPELTAERFVPDPLPREDGGEPGGRLYRTGDLVRYLPDGRLEYLGRIDHQVKIRGFRVELGEIEAALARCPEVAAAAVVVRDRKAGDEAAGERRLVACVAAQPGAEPTLASLRSFLAESLPDFMLPSGLIRVAALPLTATGKVDRRALATFEELGAESAPSAVAAPRTQVEDLLVGIWSEILGVERVGVEDNFFDLGGHSLAATRVVARVRAVLGVEVPLASLFEAPTAAGLARQIESSGEAPGAAAPLIPLPASDGQEAALPLSFAQERLWFLQQLEPGSSTYNMSVSVELAGALRVDALAAALAEVVRRQGSLRTLLFVASGSPAQRIAPFATPRLPLVDLAALSAAAAEGEAQRVQRAQERHGFDLERGPLYVALLVRLSGDRHRFLLTFHHAIADGWSIGVLVHELGTLYTASVEGCPSPLPDLPVQYADFARWQRQWMAGEQAELAYWESRLGGEVAPVELPADRPRPAVQTFRGGRRELVLPPELTARLKRFGRAEGVTLFMTLLAAIQALLSRHSGEHDIPVGAPVAGRQRAETEHLIGCFLNTLVLRTDLSGAPGFRELAARVRAVTLAAYANQNVPFEAVLSRLRLDRDLSRTPLFQVLLNMLNLPATELSLPGLDLRVLTPAEVPSKFDLTFYVSEADASVRINLVYNADLFDEARMADVLAQLESLLAQAIERPEEPMDRLSLVTAGARALLPDPVAPLDAGWIGGVHELFAAQAGRAPERPAVADGNVLWSYGDLLTGSRRLAGWLAARGARPGDVVAIYAHRSAPLVQAVLGTLTAGAAFAILDPAYPASRLVEMLSLASPRAWIALEAAGPVPGAVRRWLAEAGCACLELPAGGRASLESVAPFAAHAPRVAVGPDDVACIGFTSGSTGGPKGIAGRHGPLSHFLPSHCRDFELGPDDRFSLLSGLAHDPLQRDLFTPLYLGAAIVVPDPADFGVAGRWAAWMRREGVTVAHLTPALGQLLTERPPDGEPVVVPSLRRVFLVGESLTRRDVARLHAMAPGVTCVNLYGSTETQRAVGFHRVTREEAEAAAERARQVLPLGRGVRDAQLLVISPAGGLAGIGELGEIAVRSPHLARGYLGLDELTAERFQANPFTGEPADRIYRTGDLGRYLPDGEVAFAGRSDLQVKLRGFRIELGEIEALLASHPAVREAVALLRTDLPGGSGLAAYVVAESSESVRSLRGWLEERLPAYMVPAAFVHLESLPRTPNGKLDRRALERIVPEMAPRAGGSAAPRTPTEELVAGIWEQVLGRERVGVEESFFELGGHSLLATQVTSRIQEVFGVILPLRALFEDPTVAGLASRVSAALAGGERAPAPPIERVPRDRPLPLSFAQQRLWFLDQLAPGSAVYNMPVALRLSGRLEIAALRASLSEVVRRHESLRTVFPAVEGQPVQRIQAPSEVPLPVVDLGGLGEGLAESELARLASEHARRPFDLAAGPLLRCALVRLGEAEHAALLTQHHIISDGWSTGVLVHEIVTLYSAFVAGQPSPLPELAVQYADFAVWQRGWLAGEVLERQVSYWRERLAGVPALLELPTDRPRPAFRGQRGARLAFHLPSDPWRDLKALGRREGVTDFMTLLALFQALLGRLAGQEEL
ncbi:MAG TPA: amino acid adenylation domain-containing protein, partial [Thermoanaerobaculia bacterium]|nr:amino acid adenylation domain-containing protein [Thermoanaerobaculia bacterium]